ncbi:MAG: 30S ribosome-binding factor RbfA [Aliifodinibius sp.]|nr:30S ribosome-binding factor RbfA [Fodinibius sp.]NIX02100.1 30S ribosome-binding factor RbfA [Phycisphaerae bacterium]NIY30538.1 30S ribosome-binding factor RbfA [Fodinibius sp.]
MSSIKRRRRISELIHEEISNILQFETRDPRIGFVTVTEVDINADLTIATVYVSLLTADEEERQEILAGLESATPFLKYTLGQRVKLRHTPDLCFKVDNSLAYAERIYDLLAEIDIPPQGDDEQIDDEEEVGFSP